MKKYLLFLIVAFLFLVFSFLLIYRSQKVLGVSVVKNDSSHEIAYWLNIVHKYPEYRDGYLQLAILKFNIGEIEEAKKLINIALTIDPNFVFPLTFPLELLPQSQKL